MPAIKTLEDFNSALTQGVKRTQIDELTGLGIVERIENVLLIDSSGVGKTYLACALG